MVLDLGDQQRTSQLSSAGRTELFPLAMWLCRSCGLAQLADDAGPEAQQPTVEPRALVEHAEESVRRLVAHGHLAPGDSVREFRSPHGGAWLNQLSAAGAKPVAADRAADVVVDSLGLMHEPDQAGAVGDRVDALSASGRLVLMVHPLGAVVEQRQWTDLRHGHYAYWSLSALTGLLERYGLVVVDGFEHGLYGGVVVLVARRAAGTASDRWRRLLDADRARGLTTPEGLRPLAEAVSGTVVALQDHLRAAHERGRRVVGYPAASRAVALLRLAGVTAEQLPVVGDASPAKWGCELAEGVRVVSPEESVAPPDGRGPDEVLLFVPDLLAEFCAAYPTLAGRIVPVHPGHPRLAWPSDPVTSFARSNELQERLHRLVPGGAHTYARGADQYPEQMAPVLVRGQGALVWDVDNNCFVEYGAGLRSVTLGHAHPGVDAAVTHALRDGVNFSRPQLLEAMAAEEFCDQVPGAEMVKFAKNGSDATTAAIKVARAHTGRDLVAICDQSFFSVDDWYISHTEMDRGIPAQERRRGVHFAFNDLADLARVFDEHAGRVAAVILQPATATQEPAPGYLAAVRDLCHRHGTVLVFDEIITGFRWAAGGVQKLSGVTPDLACWAKGIGNGYAIAALTGAAALLDVGGLNTDEPRAFVLSTTYGPETVGLAALRAVLAEHREGDPIGAMTHAGAQLSAGINAAAGRAGLADHVRAIGHPSCLMFETRDAERRPSQEFRTVLLGALLTHGVLGQSLVTSAAHDDDLVAHTVAAFEAAMPTYARALTDGAGTVLQGAPVAPALRRLAAPRRL